MSTLSLQQQAGAFYQYIEGWMEQLPTLPAEEAFANPKKTAVLSVDVTQGFCYEGALSSPRVAGIVEPIRQLFERAWAHGVRHIILPQDTHEPEAVEFAQWPPHCVRGTAEAETVQAFKNLPFYDQMLVLEKNSIASGINGDLARWLDAHPEVDHFIVVGDCTDLCTYQLAMYLRLDANERQLARRVIVPANAVQTYDYPIEAAKAQGGMPHPGDVIHATFLYHMQLNGVEVVGKIQ